MFSCEFCKIFKNTFFRIPPVVTSEEWPINFAFSQGSIFGATFFLLFMKKLHDAICNIASYADNTLSFNYDQACDWECGQ